MSSEPIEVKMPSLGVSMTEGEITEWIVSDGDRVAVGDLLYAVATDKIESEIESPAAGVVTVIGVEGQTYDVGAVIATISE